MSIKTHLTILNVFGFVYMYVDTSVDDLFVIDILCGWIKNFYRNFQMLNCYRKTVELLNTKRSIQVLQKQLFCLHIEQRIIEHREESAASLIYWVFPISLQLFIAVQYMHVNLCNLVNFPGTWIVSHNTFSTNTH